MHDGYCEGDVNNAKKILSGDNAKERQNLCSDYCSKKPGVRGFVVYEPKEKGYCEGDILFGQRI